MLAKPRKEKKQSEIKQTKSGNDKRQTKTKQN